MNPGKNIHAGILLLGALAVGGCVGTHRTDLHEPLEPPAAWSQSPPASDLTTADPWVAAFEDPELTTLIETALSQQNEVRILTARVAQRLAEATVRGAGRRPQAALELNGARQQISTFGPAELGGVRFDDFGLSLNVSWELDLWGRLAAEQDAAGAELQAAAADFRALRLSLAAQVAKAWFTLKENLAQWELAKSTVASLKTNVEVVDQRFERGLAESLDLNLLSAQLASSRADLIRREHNFNAAQRRLEALLGDYPKGQILPNEQSLPPPPEMPPVGLPSSLLERRPDIEAARQRYLAAESELTAAERARLPTFSLTGSAGTSSQQFSDLLDDNFSVWRLAGNLTQPLFQGGRLRAEAERTDAVRAERWYQYQQVVLDAFIEVEQALAGETHLFNELSAIEIGVAAANNAREIAWDRYARGTADIVTALEAERNAINLRSRQLNLLNERLQNRVDLYLALGGAFDHNETDDETAIR